MRYSERQSRIEREVHEYIDEIAEELNLRVPFYPEVYWMGRKLKFEHLCLGERYRVYFDEIKDPQSGVTGSCMDRTKIILLASENKSLKAEEAAHFLHHVNSKISYNRIEEVDVVCANILSEMLGYFGSKLIDSKRKYLFSEFKDKVRGKNIQKLIKRFNKQIEKVNPEFLIPQQGYGLGEALYNFYISGEIGKRKIQKMFRDPMKGNYTPFLKFIKLKSELFL